MQLPELPTQEWRAWVAMVSLTLGGIALTLFAVWLVWILAFADFWSPAVEEDRVGYLGLGLILLLLGTIAVILSQGFAINQRELSITRDGLTMKGGAAPSAAVMKQAETLQSPK